jgi:hypothetical protein
MGGRVKSQLRKASGECLKIQRGPQVNKQSKKIALEGLTPSRSSFFRRLPSVVRSSQIIGRRVQNCH